MGGAAKLLKIMGWGMLFLAAILVLPLLPSAVLALQEAFWPPLLGLSAAIALFLSGGMLCLKRAKSQTITPMTKLCLSGGTVTLLYCIGFVALTVAWGTGARGEPAFIQFLVLFTADTILYLCAIVLFVARRPQVASYLLLIAGILSIPAGLLAIGVAVPLIAMTGSTRERNTA